VTATPQFVGRTPFAGIPDEQLLVMLHRGSPAVVRDVVAGWERLSATLDDVAESMLSGYRTMSPMWTGAAAERYGASITKLVVATRRVSQMAAAVRDLVHDSADALELAQRMFPPTEATTTALAVAVQPAADGGRGLFG
jgi:uncharacterized protein YukE